MKSGYVAIIGLPNVGKSTLFNALAGIKLSAVSPKPQTTRQRIIGIANTADYQMLFLDTPGLLEPRYALQEVMRQEITRALKDADVRLLLVEPRVPEPGTESRVEGLSRSNTVVAINKIDLVPKPQLLPIVEHYTHAGFAPVIPVSALLRDGIPELLAALRELLPEGEPYYPSDQLTTQPERFFVQELLREAVFRNFGAEIPYATLVEVTEFREQPGRKTLIRASVFVERDSQKAIVIGLRGEALKRLGSHARHDIEAFLEGPVFLELTVKVRPGWRKDQAFLRERFRES